MKLKKFNRSNSHNTSKNSLPAISFVKNGMIRINTKACEMLGLQVGDKINMHQDEERPHEWYIEKTSDAYGLVLRKLTDQGLGCNSVTITGEVFKSLRLEKTSSMRIAPQPFDEGSKIYAILTSTATR